MPARSQRSLSSRLNALSRDALPPVNWAWVVLAIIFVGYWVFVSNLERIDGSVYLARYLRPDLTPVEAANFPFPEWATLLVELFHPRVLRHFLPLIIGWWLAVQAAISLMQVLYHCPDRQTAAEFLRRQRTNRVSAGAEPYDVTSKSWAEDREKSVLLGVGGPARIFIPNGYAAVTERNARFLRVLPPGVHDLGRFEYVQGVVNLQPQVDKAEDVVMLTREGIPVRADIGLTFRIDQGGPVTPNRPYPFNEAAVRRASYAATVGKNGKVSTWAGAPIGKVKGALSKMVGEDSIDQLLAAEDYDAHQKLTDGVKRAVWDSLPKDGIKPLLLRIGRLTPPPEVSRQYTEYWLANKRKEDILARANGTAQLLQEAETARAAAEISMIQAIFEGVRHAQQEAGSKLSGYLLALRLVDALRQMFDYSADSLVRVGGDTDQLMEEIESLDDKMGHIQEQLTLPSSTFKPSSSR